MSTFGDYALVRAVPSYGGAEVLRARRARRGVVGPALHLALYGAAEVQPRLIAAADASAHGHHDRVARIHEVGRGLGGLYAVADPLEGLDVDTLIEHERARRSAPDVALAVAVALALAQTAAELLDREVWAGARGAGISSLFAAGLRLDAVVLGAGGVSLRPLAGAADDPSRPTPFRAPEMGARHAPASSATDVFAIAQVLRALCAADAKAQSAPRLGPATAGVAPILAAGLAPAPDDRATLAGLVEQLARLLRQTTGEGSAAAVIEHALAGPYRELVPPSPPDPPLPVEDARAAAAAPPLFIVWPPEPEDDCHTDRSIPAFEQQSLPSDHEAVARVFTEEGEATPTAVRLEIGSMGANGDETTQKVPVQTSDRPSPRPSASDPPWASASDVEPLEESRKRATPAAPVAIPSEIEGGPTAEIRSPFDDDKTDG